MFCVVLSWLKDTGVSVFQHKGSWKVCMLELKITLQRRDTAMPIQRTILSLACPGASSDHHILYRFQNLPWWQKVIQPILHAYGTPSEPSTPNIKHNHDSPLWRKIRYTAEHEIFPASSTLLSTSCHQAPDTFRYPATPQEMTKDTRQATEDSFPSQCNFSYRMRLGGVVFCLSRVFWSRRRDGSGYSSGNTVTENVFLEIRTVFLCTVCTCVVIVCSRKKVWPTFISLLWRNVQRP